MSAPLNPLAEAGKVAQLRADLDQQERAHRLAGEHEAAEACRVAKEVADVLIDKLGAMRGPELVAWFNGRKAA